MENWDFKIYILQIKFSFPAIQKGCHFMLPNLHCLFPFGTHKPPRTRKRMSHYWERKLSALSPLFYKSSVFFIAFIYYICKIYLSNDKSLFGAQSLGEWALAGDWEEICWVRLFIKLHRAVGEANGLHLPWLGGLWAVFRASPSGERQMYLINCFCNASIKADGFWNPREGSCSGFSYLWYYLFHKSF